LIDSPGLSRPGSPRHPPPLCTASCSALQSNPNPSSQLGPPSTPPSQSSPSTAPPSRCHTPVPSVIHHCADPSPVADARSAQLPLPASDVAGSSFNLQRPATTDDAPSCCPGQRLGGRIVAAVGAACRPASVRCTHPIGSSLPISAPAAFHLPHFPKLNTLAVKS
jgi:hypothetical protein